MDTNIHTSHATNFDQEPPQSKGSRNTDLSNFSVDPDCVHSLDSWNKRMQDITENFDEFVKQEKLNVSYVAGPYPPQDLTEEGVYLGEFLAQNEKTVFEQLAASFGNDILSHNRDWDPLEVSFRGKRPFYHRLQKNSREAPNLKDTLESWIHFPVNHVVWMNVITKSSLTQVYADVYFKDAISPSILRSQHVRSSDLIGVVQQARSNLPHSRYIQPMFDLVEDESGFSRLRHVRIAVRPLDSYQITYGLLPSSHEITLSAASLPALGHACRRHGI